MNVLVVAVVVSLISPAVLAWITGRQRRREKFEDWARQDAREQAAIERQDEVADKVAEVAQTAATSAHDTAERLEVLGEGQKVIHGLVNSNLTAQKQETLDSTRRELVLMKVIAGDAPSGSQAAAITAIEERIAELASELAKRDAQEDIAAATHDST